MSWLSKSTRFYHLYNRVPLLFACKRYLLSGSYKCDDVWAARLSSPLLKKLTIAEFSVKLMDKFDKDGAASAVDLDILANKLEEADPKHLDFLINFFERFYKTREYLKATKATNHALIRTLLAQGDTDRLFSMLLDKMRYGMFLDDYTSVLLLDHFIEKKQFQEAALIAYEHMFQEDFSNPLIKAMSWYASHMHWKSILQQMDGDTSEAVEAAEEDEEEVTYKRVDYIEKPYYDGHWDIPKDSMKLGKTFIALSEGQNDLLNTSYSVIGNGLLEKFDNGLQVLQEVLDSDGRQITLEALESFASSLEGITTKEPPEEEIAEGLLTMDHMYPYITAEQKEELVSRLQALQEKLQNAADKIVDRSFESDLEQAMLESIKKHECELIETQKKEYSEWEKIRETLVQEQIAEIQVKQKKLAIAERLLQMQEKEELLQFFENQSRITMSVKKIDNREAILEKRRKIEEVEESYV